MSAIMQDYLSFFHKAHLTFHFNRANANGEWASRRACPSNLQEAIVLHGCTLLCCTVHQDCIQEFGTNDSSLTILAFQIILGLSVSTTFVRLAVSVASCRALSGLWRSQTANGHLWYLIPQIQLSGMSTNLNNLELSGNSVHLEKRDRTGTTRTAATTPSSLVMVGEFNRNI